MSSLDAPSMEVISDMKYTASMHVYDCLSTVQYAVTVTSWPEDTSSSRPEVVLSRSGCVPGVGETDPGHWLSEALVAALESL